MEKFEVFNRSTGQWEKQNIEIVSGWNENWVQDKTTDSLNLKIKYRNETAPNWNCGDWCRFLHLSGNETGATYKDIILERIPAGDLTSKLSVSYNAELGDYGGFEVSCTETLTEQVKVAIYFITSSDGITGQTHNEIITLEKGTDNATYLLEDGEIYNTTIDGPVQITQIYRYSWLHIPLNHEQYILGNINFVKNEIAGEWDCQLTLKEPIEIANGILVETRSFTNQISKIVDNIEYTHDALTHLNVLETILKTTPANNDLSKSWYSRITILNKGLLASTPFNDETYSEQSLYGILMDKYDSAIGRTPVLYFDMNDQTDLPNNLTKETYILDFLRQDGYDKESVDLDDLLENNSECIINKSDENATDGIVSNYDNLSINTTTYYPSESYWTVPEIDTDERDISNYGTGSDTKGTNSKWILRIPHLIKKINKISRFKIGTTLDPAQQISQLTSSVNYKYRYEDIEYLFEEKTYNAETDANKRNKCAWYKEGDNKVHINEIERTDDFVIGSLTFNTMGVIWLYNIEYEPLINARYDLGKDYQTQLNQNDSQVDNAKFGKYIKDYLASMNKADLVITKTVSNFNDIVEIGTRVIDGSKNYLITNISIQNRGFDYDVVYQLNENHFRRSDNIVASQEIRKNIEIGIDATKERKSMLPFEYKISLNSNNDVDSLNVKNYLVSSLLTDTSNLEFIQTALLNIKGTYKNQGAYSIQRYCEVIKYVLNNTFCLNMRYFDNAEAGKQKELASYTMTDRFGASYTAYRIPKSQLPMLYTNYFGEFDKFDIDFQPLKTDLSDILDLENSIVVGDDRAYYKDITLPSDDYDNINREIVLSANYPMYDADLAETSILQIENINYYKDMLDTFNYTVGFHIESDEQIILCQAFFNNSILITNTGAKISAIKTYAQNMQENDYDITDYVETSAVSGTIDDNEITITLTDTLNKAKSIILVDADNKPLLIINDFDEFIGTNTFTMFKIYC